VLQRRVDERVRLLPHVRREIVPTVGVDDAEGVGRTEQLVHLLRCGRRLLHALHGEVVIVQRRVGEEGPRCQRRDHFVEIERHLLRVELVGVPQAGHVAVAGPPGDLAAVVVGEGGPAAA
jgi:hypothetical protein